MLGIDIASYQEQLNLQSAKNAGVQAVIIKATQGNNYKNPCLQKHVDQAKQLGLNFGLYHYYDKKYGTAEQQAEYFCNTIKGLGYNIIPVLDFEEAAQIDKVNNIHRFMDYCTKALGVTPILYTYASYLSYLDSSTYKYKLWVAFYMSMSSALKDFNRCKRLYPIVNNYTIAGYQYASCWKINGYSGNLDVDEFYDSAFIGSANVVNSTPIKPINTFNPHLKDLQSAFNKDYGRNIYVDGIRGQQVENMLNTICLRNGSRGYCVGWLQCRVGAKIDDIFGNETKNKVMNFQRNNGLVVDGIAGKNTFNKLLEIYK